MKQTDPARIKTSRQESLVLRNKMMVALMHPLLRNLREMRVENVLVLSAIHHSSSDIFFHPISLDSEDSCCSTPGDNSIVH